MAFLLLFTAMMANSMLRPRTAPVVNYTSSMQVQASQEAKKLKAQHAGVSSCSNWWTEKLYFTEREGSLGH